MDRSDVWDPTAQGQKPALHNLSSTVNCGAKSGLAFVRPTVRAFYWGQAKRIGTMFYPSFVLPIGTSDASAKEFAHQYEDSRQATSLMPQGKRRSAPTRARDCSS